MICTSINSLKLDEEYLEQIKRFKYLRVVINGKGDLEEEINERAAKTGRLSRTRSNLNSTESMFWGKK